MRAPVAESPYHSRCQNRLVTGRVVGNPETRHVLLKIAVFHKNLKLVVG